MWKLKFLLEIYGKTLSPLDTPGGRNKKKALNNPRLLSRFGRGRIMLFEKNKQLSTHRFGELELVDKSLFFLCTNRRDN
jgi:hypothetical protein